MPENDDFSLEGLNLSELQRKAIKNLDMANQLAMIKALREQQGIEKPHSKTENDELRIHNAPTQYADERRKNNTPPMNMQEVKVM